MALVPCDYSLTINSSLQYYTHLSSIMWETGLFIAIETTVTPVIVMEAPCILPEKGFLHCMLVCRINHMILVL